MPIERDLELEPQLPDGPFQLVRCSTSGNLTSRTRSAACWRQAACLWPSFRL